MYYYRQIWNDHTEGGFKVLNPNHPEPESEWPTREEAADRVAYLNGGGKPTRLEIAAMIVAGVSAADGRIRPVDALEEADKLIEAEQNYRPGDQHNPAIPRRETPIPPPPPEPKPRTRPK